VKGNNLFKGIRHSCGANWKIMVIIHAEQRTVKQQENTVSTRQMFIGGNNRNKDLKNANST
jgi:hypothetical protein